MAVSRSKGGSSGASEESPFAMEEREWEEEEWMKASRAAESPSLV